MLEQQITRPPPPPAFATATQHSLTGRQTCDGDLVRGTHALEISLDAAANGALLGSGGLMASGVLPRGIDIRLCLEQLLVL